MARPRVDWIPYEQVKPWVHKLRLGNYKEWLEYATTHKLPEGVPQNPQMTYPDYVSDADFLGHTSYWPYPDAKRYAQSLKLSAYSEWLTWYNKNKPKFIPKYPDQVSGYRDEWEGWGEFLGTGTIAHEDREYRSFDEHVKYAHSLLIKTQDEWRSIDHPEDIHHLPPKYFKEWTNWDHFLGRNIAERAAVKQVNTSVLYVIHESGNPANVLTIDIETNGKGSLQMRQQQENFRILRVFKYEPELEQQIQNIIAANGQKWWAADNQYLINVQQALLSDFFQLLEIV